MAEQIENAMTVDWWWEEEEYGIPLSKKKKGDNTGEQESGWSWPDSCYRPDSCSSNALFAQRIKEDKA